jgi:hypothetical protein
MELVTVFKRFNQCVSKRIHIWIGTFLEPFITARLLSIFFTIKSEHYFSGSTESVHSKTSIFLEISKKVLSSLKTFDLSKIGFSKKHFNFLNGEKIVKLCETTLNIFNRIIT